MPSISSIAISTGATYNEVNSRIISDKFKKLPYYTLLRTASRHGEDGILAANAEGYEFVQQYGTYSNYLNCVESEKIAAEQTARRSSLGSYLSGVGAIIAIHVSALSLYYTYTRSNSQTETNKALTDSLRIVKIRTAELEQSSFFCKKFQSRKTSRPNH